MKVINLTKTKSSDLNNLVFGEYLEIIDLPKNLKRELNKTLKKVSICASSNIEMLEEIVIKACTELSIIASLVSVFNNEDLKDELSIQDAFKTWQDDSDSDDPLSLSDKNVKSKGFGVLIDAPNFMMYQLQSDMSFLTNHLFIKNKKKIVPAISY